MTSTLPSPKLTPLHDGIVNKLMSFIQDSLLIAGDKLPTERILAAQLETSRSSLRVALKFFIDKGILASKQGSGTYVANIDMAPKTLNTASLIKQNTSLYEQLIEFRMILEPAIAEIAAEKCTMEQLNKLKIIVCDQQKNIIVNSGDGTLDAQFHLALAEATGNILLVETIDKINKLYLEGRTDNLRNKEWRQFSVISHLRIIDAIEKRSKAECRKEVEEHLSTVYKNHAFFKKGD